MPETSSCLLNLLALQQTKPLPQVCSITSRTSLQYGFAARIHSTTKNQVKLMETLPSKTNAGPKAMVISLSMTPCLLSPPGIGSTAGALASRSSSTGMAPSSLSVSFPALRDGSKVQARQQQQQLLHKGLQPSMLEYVGLGATVYSDSVFAAT